MDWWSSDKRVRLLVGDNRKTLKTLADKSVYCCVTSPPYWGLRDYGTGRWEGGDSNCDHMVTGKPRASRPKGRLGGGTETVDAGTIAKSRCPKCGAIRIDDQIGLEETPDEYVEKMVGVFREVRRVLRDDGTLWINLGDSFYGSASTVKKGLGLKPKDLVGIPWMVAFALRADGWYLRSEIIWEKPNAQPESVKDRPTRSHENLFLFSKSESYFYDHAAVKEPITESSVARITQATFASQTGGPKDYGKTGVNANRSTRKTIENFAKSNDGTRNKRSVWTVPTKLFSEAHFATHPPKLIIPCIKAGCPEGGKVLDPFGGSGTTAAVAVKFNRKAILCELNPQYAELIKKSVERASDHRGLFR